MKFIIVLLWAMLVASPVFAQEAKSNSLFDLINIETFPVARVNVTGDSAQNADFQQFHDSKRFLRLGFEFTTDFGLEVNLNLDITQGITANKKNPLFLNIPFAPGIGLTGFIDTHTPFESYVAYEGDLIDLSVGRRRWAMGAGDYSLSVGSHAPWFDGMWFNLHPTLSGHRFDWTFLVAADKTGYRNFVTGQSHDSFYEKIFVCTEYRDPLCSKKPDDSICKNEKNIRLFRDSMVHENNIAPVQRRISFH